MLQDVSVQDSCGAQTSVRIGSPSSQTPSNLSTRVES